MAVNFNIQFRINATTRVIRLTDTSTGFTYGKGCFKVEFPDGSVRNLPDFANPDLTASGGSIDIPCVTDINNNVITGAYTISYAVTDNTSTIQTPLSRQFDFNWIEPSNGITNLSDVVIPEVVFRDATSYSPIGSFTGTLTRTLSSSFPSTSEASTQTPVSSTSSNTINVVSAVNYYEGVYTPTSAVSITYTHSSNSWLTVYYSRTFSKTFSIKKCPNQLELVAKINTYRGIIDAYKETNDTQFNILSEQYDLVIALYSHLITRYQTSTQDGSEPILRELLSILEPYTGTYSYQATKMLPFELAASTTNSFTISDGTNTDPVALGSTLTFASGSAALVPIVTNNNVTYSPTFGTTLNTFAQGNDSRFHNPVTIGTANGLSISTQALSLAAATSGSAGAMSASDKTKLDGIATGATANTGTVTSVALTTPAAFTVTGSPITASGTLAITAAGTSAQYITGAGALATLNTLNVPENTNLYFTPSRARTSISLTTTGTTGAATYDNTTGILNIPSYIGGVTSFNTRTGAIVLSSSDVTTALTYIPVPNNRSLTINGVSYDLSADRNWTIASGVTSFNTRTGAITPASGDYTTALVTEVTNLYYTDARARAAISLTTTGTSGAATYSSTTGVLNIPAYQGGVTSFNTRTGAITLTSGDVTTALTYTPYNATNPAGYISGITSGQVTTALSYTPENSANKGIANGYASLDGGGLVPSTQLPSYVDDVLEYTNLAGFPASGTTGKIYVALDTNKIYRWSGTTYIEVSPTVGTIWGGITGTLSNQTDLQNALNLKYNTPTGTTAQYVAGDGSLITFPVAGQSGSLVRLVRNQTGATLTKGTVVYISGATGNNPIVSKAIATGDATSAQTFGLLQADVANNATGYVVMTGDLTGLDTSAFTEGQQLYLSGTVAGTYTATKTLAPTHLVYIGIITRSHPTLGQIEVKVQNGYELGELHNVAAPNGSSLNNDGLFWETSTQLWKNKSIATILGYTPANAARSLTINGTAYDLTADRTWSVGTVTSVGLTVPTGFTNGTSVTTSGNLTLGFATGYSLPTTASQTNWDTAYTNRITALTTTGSSGSATLVSNTLNVPTYTLSGLGGQPLATNLTSLSGLAYVSASFVKMTAAGTFSLDTNTYYLSSNPSSYIALTALSSTATGLTYTNTTGIFSLTSGYVIPATTSATNWDTAYTNRITSLTTTGSSGAATLVSNTLNIPTYTLAGLGGVASTRTLTINGTTYDLSADRTWTISTNPSARNEQNFTATANQTTFTITGGYVVGLVDVYVNGVRYLPSDYTATNGTTVVLGIGLLAGDAVTILNYTSSIAALPTSRNVQDFTATAAQTTFTVTNGYIVGLIDVFVNGSKLTSSEFTATNGTTFVLTVASTVGDQVQSINYTASVNGISGAGTANYVPKFTATGTIGNSSIQDLTTGVLVSNSVTAASAIARGIYQTPTLVASANSDVLVGLDVNPTFTTGAFTSISRLSARFTGNVLMGQVPTSLVGYSYVPLTLSNNASGAIKTQLALVNAGGFSGAGSAIDFFTYTDAGNGLPGVRLASIDNGSFSGNLQILTKGSTYGGTDPITTKFQIFGTTGNLTLQNGGTFTDAGYRLDVAGTTRFIGTTASDTAPLGSELAAVTGTGTNWTLAGTNLNVGGYTHTTGSVVPLTTTLAAVSGTYYQITYTITGRTAGSISIAYGGTLTGATATGAYGLLASSTAVLTITPTTDFDGTIVLSIKSIGTSSASSTFANSSGVSIIEVRASSVISNTFIGLNAGRRNTTGDSNTFIGSNAGQNNTSGYWNTFIGNSTGNSNYTGNGNTFIGFISGTNNTSGYDNTFIGNQAGRLNTTGPNNTAIGSYALYNSLYVSGTTAIGQNAGYSSTGGQQNIFLGFNSGRYAGSSTTANQTSSNSLYIGYDVRSSASGNTNEVVIAGYNGSAGQVGLGSNTTVLGNSSTVTTAIYGNLLLGGTTDAGYRLDVVGTARVSGAATFSSSVSATSFNATTTNIFSVDATERMRITSAGNVGIGTSSPRATLDISDGTVNTSGEAIYQGLFTGPSRPSTSDLTAILTIQSNDAMAINKGGSIAFGGRAVASNSAGANWAGISGLKENATGSDYSGYLQFWTRGGSQSEKMRITSGGNLLINRTATGGQNARVQVSSSGTDGYFIEQISSGGFCNASIAINNGGTYYFNYFQAGATGVGSITSNGSTTSYNVTSDYRLKEDLREIKGLEKISAIKVYDYKYKSSNMRMDGVLAHELQEVIPYAVTGEKDGEYMQGVDYSKIVPVLVKAIQELSAENTSLINRIEALENK